VPVANELTTTVSTQEVVASKMNKARIVENFFEKNILRWFELLKIKAAKMKLNLITIIIDCKLFLPF
jgi:hypothetical protein